MNSDDSAERALTALCEAASQARTCDDNGNGVGIHKASRARYDGDFDDDHDFEGDDDNDDGSSISESSSSSRKPKKKKKSGRGSHASRKRRKSTASSSSTKRRVRKGKRSSRYIASGATAGAGSDDDEELSYAISQLPKPKRAMTAYNFFFQAERKKLIEMGLEAYEAMMSGRPPPDPEKCSKERVPFQLIGKIIGKYWKLISADDLKRYQMLANEDAKRYERERKIYAAEVASVRDAWNRQDQAGGKGGSPPRSLGQSIFTESGQQSTCSSGHSQGIGSGSDEALNQIIQTLTEEQIQLLLSLQNRQKQNQQPSQYPQQDLQGHNPLLAPVIEQLQLTLPPPSVVTANPSPASAIGVSSAPSGFNGNTDLASILLQQSQQLSLIQDQVNMLNQLQNQQQQPPPPMPLVVPQQDHLPMPPSLQPFNDWQGVEQQPQVPLAPMSLQQPPLPPFPNQNQQQHQRFQFQQSVPTEKYKYKAER